jgi:hypothetical protein
MEEEVWRDIPGHEGRYQASSLGRIRSLDRTVTQLGRWGRPFTRKLKGQVLRPAGNKYNPHPYVVLGHGHAGSPVHQLVAAAFLGPRPEGCDVRHIDGDATNNRANNLCYGSRTENILDVYRIGRPWRKLTLDDIRDIYTRVRGGEKGVDLAREYNISQSAISAIKVGRYKSCSII